MKTYFFTSISHNSNPSVKHLLKFSRYIYISWCRRFEVGEMFLLVRGFLCIDIFSCLYLATKITYYPLFSLVQEPRIGQVCHRMGHRWHPLMFYRSHSGIKVRQEVSKPFQSLCRFLFFPFFLFLSLSVCFSLTLFFHRSPTIHPFPLPFLFF